MNKLIWFFITALVFLLIGCAGQGPIKLKPGDICYEATDSLICDVTNGDPRKLDSLLLGVNMVALESDSYNEEEAIKVIDQILDFIGEGDVTYLMAVNEVTKQIEHATALALVASPYLDQLSKPIPVSKYDLKMFKAHLTKQKALITSFMGD